MTKSTAARRHMPRGRSSFTRTALRRAIRAAADAGVELARVEVDPTTGKIALIPGKPDDGNNSDLDRWMREHKT